MTNMDLDKLSRFDDNINDFDQFLVVEGQVHRMAIKLPMFWHDHPALWLSQAESAFASSNITNEVAKFNYVTLHLDKVTALEMQDIILDPNFPRDYSKLKDQLINRLTVPEEQRVRNFNTKETWDPMPSACLRHLRTQAGPNPIDDTLLRQLWLLQLPASIQEILSAQSNLDLDQMAEIADTIMASSRSTAGVINYSPSKCLFSGDLEHLPPTSLHTSPVNNASTPSLVSTYGVIRKSNETQTKVNFNISDTLHSLRNQEYCVYLKNAFCVVIVVVLLIVFFCMYEFKI